MTPDNLRQRHASSTRSPAAPPAPAPAPGGTAGGAPPKSLLAAYTLWALPLLLPPAGLLEAVRAVQTCAEVTRGRSGGGGIGGDGDWAEHAWRWRAFEAEGFKLAAVVGLGCAVVRAAGVAPRDAVVGEGVEAERREGGEARVAVASVASAREAVAEVPRGPVSGEAGGGWGGGTAADEAAASCTCSKAKQ